jgi:hypothetical protein
MTKKPVVQLHHIIYGSPDHPEQEVMVKVFKGEHLIASRLRWYTRKRLSLGLVQDLDVFLALNRHRAEEIK